MLTSQAREANRPDRLSAQGDHDLWQVIVPGVPQWRKGQQTRAFVFLGMYLSALSVSVFGWGSEIGALLLGVAFVTHCTSVAEAIRTLSFPGFGGWAPWFSSVVGLGAVGYLPALLVALHLAYPAWNSEGGYLVNRTSYVQQAPEPGQRVWLSRDAEGLPPGMAKVVAVAGQVVSWSSSGLLIDGRGPMVDLGAVSGFLRSRGSFEVPEDSLLVLCPTPPCPGADGPEIRSSQVCLTIVSADQVVGKPWACSYPIWRRGLLG